jgi:hypothetical protein
MLRGGRGSLPTLRDISTTNGAGFAADSSRPTRTDAIAIVSRDASRVLAHIDRERHPFVVGYAMPHEVPPGSAPVVVVIAEELLGEDPSPALQRIRHQTPAAKFVFLAFAATAARARALAPWGAVLSEQTNGNRLERALRHAAALATMAAEMQRLRQTGRFKLPGARSTPDRE